MALNIIRVRHKRLGGLGGLRGDRSYLLGNILLSRLCLLLNHLGYNLLWCLNTINTNQLGLED